METQMSVDLCSELSKRGREPKAEAFMAYQIEV
jgi:hypothetical protein